MNEAIREILRRQKDHTHRLERLEVQEASPFGSAASFPASPWTNQRFYRSDLGLECVYNGTYWHAVNPHWVTPDEIGDVPLGNWNFNRRYAPTIYDATPRGNDLTLQGSPSTGVLNDARARYYTLNGSTQYMTSTAAEFGNWSLASGCIWFYATAVGAQQMLMSDDNNATRGWAFQLTSADLLGFSGSVAGVAGTTTILVNTWYLAFFVHTGGNVSLYLYSTSTESVEVASTAIAIGAYTGQFEIGRRNHSTPNYFAGRVAAPKFYIGPLMAARREYIALCEIALVKG